MTLEQAKQKRDEHKHLIGQRAKDADANIHDVIVIPVDNLGGFLSEYRMYIDEIGNDEMLMNYPSKSSITSVL